MAEEYSDYTAPLLSEFNTKLRDIEEKQRLLKERVLLIGQNLIEIKEETDKEITTLKINTEEIKQDLKKIKYTLIRLTEEVEKWIKKLKEKK